MKQFWDISEKVAATVTKILGGQKIEVEEVEEILDQIMQDEFNTVLEDDSPYVVIKIIVMSKIDWKTTGGDL